MELKDLVWIWVKSRNGTFVGQNSKEFAMKKLYRDQTTVVTQNWHKKNYIRPKCSLYVQKLCTTLIRCASNLSLLQELQARTYELKSFHLGTQLVAGHKSDLKLSKIIKKLSKVTRRESTWWSATKFGPGFHKTASIT